MNENRQLQQCSYVNNKLSIEFSLDSIFSSMIHFHRNPHIQIREISGISFDSNTQLFLFIILLICSLNLHELYRLVVEKV